MKILKNKPASQNFIKQQFAKIDQRIVQVDKKINQTSQDFGQIINDLAIHMDQRFKEQDEKFEKKFDKLEIRLVKRIDKKIDSKFKQQTRDLLDSNLQIVQELKAMRQEITVFAYRQSKHQDQIEHLYSHLNLAI